MMMSQYMTKHHDKTCATSKDSGQLAHQQRDKRELVSHLMNAQSDICVEVLRPSQPDGVMSSSVSLPNHTFTGQA